MPESTTRQGIVRGIDEDGIFRFGGIPFAAPPTGERRFRPPTAPEPWEGVRDASEFGATAPQSPMPFLGEDEPRDEDCLFLNVWTPGVDDARRPVMVWIHGGAFFMGSGSGTAYGGSSLAARGDVVVVTLNYRLGVLGFLHLAELDADYAGSGNNGILDQIAALEWVRDNIAGFGGDPDNVTIFGESAGGMSVGTLLGTPAARGLFHRAIAQSGAAHNSLAPKRAADVTNRILETLGGGGIARLLSASSDEILAAQADLLTAMFTEADQGFDFGADAIGMPFQPVVDEVVLAEQPLEAVRGGLSADVELVVGTTQEEWKLFALMASEDVDEDRFVGRLTSVMGDGHSAAAVYRAEFPDLSPKERFGASVTDLVFRQPAIRLAEAQSAHQPNTFMYLFTWRTPAFGGMLGSCHALEIPFVFGNVAGPLAMFVGDDPPAALVDAMQASWLRFARSGDPTHDDLPWPAYDLGRRSTMEFTALSQVVDDPESARRELWADLL